VQCSIAALIWAVTAEMAWCT